LTKGGEERMNAINATNEQIKAILFIIEFVAFLLIPLWIVVMIWYPSTLHPWIVTSEMALAWFTWWLWHRDLKPESQPGEG